jgi:hypothetical protein
MKLKPLSEKPDLLVLFLLFMVLLAACEKEIVGEQEPFSPGDAEPVLRNETVNSVSSDSYSVNQSFENPFEGVELHQPSAIGLVKSGKRDLHKSTGTEEDYFLYEMASDSFRMVYGKEGNEILFRNVQRMDRINDTWQILTGGWGAYQGEIILVTQEEQINYAVEVSTDSIFTSDTVFIADYNRNKYRDKGDTLFHTIDTAKYKDHIYVQLTYLYTDTLSFQADTLTVLKEKTYKSLLMNTGTGDLYDIGRSIWNPLSEGYAYMQPGFYDYDPDINSVYFFLGTFQIGKINLNEVALEIINMPTEPLEFPITDRGTWCVLEDDHVLFPHQGLKCYIPGSGIRSKTNWPDPLPTFQALHWRGKDNQRYLCSGVAAQVYSVRMENDSIILDDMEYTSVHQSTALGEPGILPEFAGQYHVVNHNGASWYYDGMMYYSFHEDQKEIRSFSIANGVFTNGMVSFVNSGGNIYKVDFDQMDVEFLFSATASELDNVQFSINTSGNPILSGFRLYDLKSVYIEYDGSTGEKLNEWEETNTPPETQIIHLSSIF